jgi:thymidylate kinase
VTRIAVDGIDAAGKTTLADRLGVLLQYLERVDPRAHADIVVAA